MKRLTDFFGWQCVPLCHWLEMVWWLPIGRSLSRNVILNQLDMMRKNLFYMVLSFCVLQSPGVLGQKIPSAALRADLDTLYRTLQEVHVDLFAVAGREKLDSMVTALHQELAAADSVSLRTFYFGLIPFFEAIGDGHTLLYDSPVKNSPVFPFGVAIPNDSTLLVRHNYLPDSPLPVDSRIDSINGRSAREIIRSLVTLRPGERMHFRLAMLEEDFYRYYSLFYRDTAFLVRAVTPDGTVYCDTISGIPYEVFKQEAIQDENEPFRFDILSDTVALFEFRSMRGQYEKRFRSFLDTMFRTLRERRIPNLIIDIRQNGGGNSALGDMLMRRLSRKPFTQFGKTLIKSSRQEIKAHMAQYRDDYPKEYTEEMILADMNRNFPFGTIRTYEEPSRKYFTWPLRKRNRYRGKVWLLTSHYTFSAATDFSWAFQYFDMGTVVGEETGGMVVSFGDTFGLRLPNTGLLYVVSFKKFYNYGADDKDIHGTLPDYPVAADQALEHTLRLIRKSSSRVK